MTEHRWEIIVIGAGAAGLMAAMRAAELGRRVLLLEKNRKPGVKILMSGGTRCNITHACDNRGIVEAFGKNGRFLHSALAMLSVQDVIKFFEGEGVATKVEDTGKIFPVSNRALDVLNALLQRLEKSGATLALEEPVTDIRQHADGWEIVTNRHTFIAPRLIVTTGGQSYPGCGTRGDGYAFMEKLGHTITPRHPALVPITVDAPWVKDLQGITLQDVTVRVMEANKALATRRSSMLFAHFGLTGPAALDPSRAIVLHPAPTSLQLELDFLPNTKEPEFDEFLKSESLASGKKQLAVILSSLMPRRLADTLLTLTGQEADRKMTGLSKVDRSKLVVASKRLRVPIRGTMGYEKAEVTTGGVSLEEVDSRSMESRKLPGLYLAGEILDVDGPIGGYNFQAAWSTGFLAGTRAAQSLTTSE